MNEVSEFALRVTDNGRGSVVLIAGDLDLLTAPKLRACLRDFTGQTVTLDFSEVTFMDSSALSVLVTAYKKAFQTGGRIVLSGVQPAQMRLFEVTGLTEDLNFDGDGAAASS